MCMCVCAHAPWKVDEIKKVGLLGPVENLKLRTT